MGRKMLERIKTNCKYCDQTFVVRISDKDRPFCSRDCYHAWLDAQRARVACTQCGKVFTITPARIKEHNFCSRECLAEWRRANWKGKQAPQYTGVRHQRCPICGKFFERVNHNQIICSTKCAGQWRSAHWSGNKAANWRGGMVTVTCAQCGNTIQRLRSELNRSENFFCNLECRGRWQSSHIVGEQHPNWQGNHFHCRCAYCGKSLDIPAWHAQRDQDHFFCNASCMGNWFSENLTGEKRYNWKGGVSLQYGPNWKSQKTKARKRDDYCCQYCGKQETKFSRRLHVHHIVPFRAFDYIADENDNYKLANELSNLITLCHSCHAKAEAGLISIQPKLL